jgi:hypothetical protein
MSAKRNTPEGDRLDVLVTLIEAYEADISRLISPTRSKPSSSDGAAESHSQGSRSLHRPPKPRLRSAQSQAGLLSPWPGTCTGGWGFQPSP